MLKILSNRWIVGTLYLFGIAIAGADCPLSYMWVNFIGVLMLCASLAIVILTDRARKAGL